MSQELNLKGQVFEKETDIPLAGATIQVVGSESGVISDFDGNFEILLKIGDNIQISYLGKKTIELINDYNEGAFSYIFRNLIFLHLLFYKFRFLQTNLLQKVLFDHLTINKYMEAFLLIPLHL